jgi:hypothetical protein
MKLHEETVEPIFGDNIEELRKERTRISQSLGRAHFDSISGETGIFTIIGLVGDVHQNKNFKRISHAYCGIECEFGFWVRVRKDT